METQSNDHICEGPDLAARPELVQFPVRQVSQSDLEFLTSLLNRRDELGDLVAYYAGRVFRSLRRGQAVEPGIFEASIRKTRGAVRDTWELKVNGRCVRLDG